MGSLCGAAKATGRDWKGISREIETKEARRKLKRNGDDPEDDALLLPHSHCCHCCYRRPLLWKVQPASSVCTIPPKQSRQDGEAHCCSKHCGANQGDEQTARLHVTPSSSQAHSIPAAALTVGEMLDLLNSMSQEGGRGRQA